MNYPRIAGFPAEFHQKLNIAAWAFRKEQFATAACWFKMGLATRTMEDFKMKKWIDIGVQGLLGLVFFVFGLNGFLHFLEEPAVTGDAETYMGGLAAAKYFFPVLKTVEVLSGLLLLIRRLPGLALLLLAPVVVQIFLFHSFLDPNPQGLVLATVLVSCEAYLGFVVYADRFKAVLRP